MTSGVAWPCVQVLHAPQHAPQADPGLAGDEGAEGEGEGIVATEDCPVCLAKLDGNVMEGRRRVERLVCGHEFHQACVQE